MKIYLEPSNPTLKEFPIERFKLEFQFEKWSGQMIQNKTRALVIGSQCDICMAVFINGTWIDEGAMCYAGGNDSIDGVEYYSILDQ